MSNFFVIKKTRFEAEKLYFARLRVRLHVHRKVVIYLTKTQKKSACLSIVEFLIMKQAAFLYDDLRNRLDSDSDGMNAFNVADHEKWEMFKNTKSYWNIVQLLLDDTDSCLRIMTSKYEKCETWMSVLTPQLRQNLSHYIGMINFDYEDNMWASIDLLVSKLVVKVFEKSVADISNKKKKIEVLKLLNYVKIMQIMNNLGVFEISYLGEEFADDIKTIDKLETEEELIQISIKLNSWEF